MRVLATDKNDSTLVTIEAVSTAYDTDTREMFIYITDDSAFILDDVDSYDYEGYAKELFNTGRIDTSSRYKGKWDMSEDE